MIKNISDILIETIKEHYLTSPDYNGINASLLKNPELRDIEIRQEIAALVSDGLVGVLSNSFDTNPYINRFGFPDIEHQLAELQNAFMNCVLYPTSKLLASEIDNECTTPMEHHLRLGHPQLKVMFFEYDVLLIYALDPRFYFEFNDYSGRILSSNEVDKRRYINLKTFGIGRDGDRLVIAAFPRYLRNMSPANQMLWESHRIQDVSNCKVLKNYLDNEIHGSWSFPNTVYHSILKEIENVNALSENIFGVRFFRKVFKKNELPDFDILPFPSRHLYNDFLLLLEKITVGNINETFFNDRIDNVMLDNGKRKGSLNCLEEWLEQVSPKGKDFICKPLKKVRKERQSPAHKIQSNSYIPELLDEQHKMCISVYDSLNSLRILLSSHPLANEVNLPHKSTQYLEV